MPPLSQSHRGTGHAPKHVERIYTRLTPEMKVLVERAAAFSGQTLSQFVRKATQDAAMEAIEQHEILVLSARESQAVIEALTRPQPPNARLVQAAERYKAVMGEK